ncbi:hypothetical protein EP1X_09005 [Thermococcus sp. EP1]|nr:hypothetical protein EP1X_09005 [Thermococcus sp. EP1]
MVLFIFSDESGQVKKGGYYLRSALVIPEREYFNASEAFFNLKNEYGIPLNDELKAADLWTLKRYLEIANEEGYKKQKKKYENLVKEKPWLSTENKGYAHYLEFFEKSLALLPESTCIIIVWTYFFDTTFKPQNEIEKDFLRTIMLRIEDCLREREEYGIIIYDEGLFKELSAVYNDIFFNPKYFEKYSRIKDSVAFEVSKYSFGLQLVDYVSNVTYNAIRNFSTSNKLFRKYLKSKVRRVKSYSIRQTGFVPLYVSRYHGKNNEGEELIEKVMERLGLT